ncbi:hypothetical protein [Pseudarthrobacter sp. PS3-L1]|uniref:hypothetical protein n=1 Tax=Pseudarthrobacter sp. PS3-L1 TaxID=3046207 RepID=UPI0024BA1127|nr:hypothetical protein [Pseudarthrobacter sp. PS3-L1]MDJ0319515.1 hypothetical protein [Pseudarthrobacter sp. PS3-L1]
MSAFGYRISLFQLAIKGRPKDTYPFDHKSLGGSLLSLLDGEIKQMVNQGEADDRKSTFFTVDSERRDNWGLVTEASGGAYGSEARAVNVTSGQKTKDISSDEAVLRGSRIVFIVPPSGEYGIIISEVQGNASLLSPFVNQLNFRLGLKNLRIHLEKDVADGVAWMQYLNSSDVGITGVELVTKQSVDQTSFDFSDSSGVSGVRMFVGITPGSGLAKKFAATLKSMVGKGRQPFQLVGLVGLKDYADSDFDEEKIITVQDGQKRILEVSHGWPRFVYPLDTNVRPSEQDFLKEIQSSAFSVLHEVGITPPQGWFPK